MEPCASKQLLPNRLSCVTSYAVFAPSEFEVSPWEFVCVPLLSTFELVGQCGIVEMYVSVLP